MVKIREIVNRFRNADCFACAVFRFRKPRSRTRAELGAARRAVAAPRRLLIRARRAISARRLMADAANATSESTIMP